MRQGFLRNLQPHFLGTKNSKSKYVLAVLPVEVIKPFLLYPVRRGLAGQFPVAFFQFR